MQVREVTRTGNWINHRKIGIMSDCKSLPTSGYNMKMVDDLGAKFLDPDAAPQNVGPHLRSKIICWQHFG